MNEAALAKPEHPSEIAAKLPPEDYDLIKRSCGGGKLDDDEMRLFLFECARRKVHPLSKLIYPMVFVDSKGVRTLTFVTSIDYMRAKADETGEYAPGSPTEYEYNRDGVLLFARVHVLKFVKGQMVEFSEEAAWKEFLPGQEFKQAMWKKMPRVMLAKCAEARALRRGWPKELHGIYAEEEMDQASDPPAGSVPVLSKKGDEPWPADDGEALSHVSDRIDRLPHPKATTAWAKKHAVEVRARGEAFAGAVHALLVARRQKLDGENLAKFQPGPEEKPFVDAMLAAFASFAHVDEFDIWAQGLDESVTARWRPEMRAHVKAHWQQARTRLALKAETEPPDMTQSATPEEET